MEDADRGCDMVDVNRGKVGGRGHGRTSARRSGCTSCRPRSTCPRWSGRSKGAIGTSPATGRTISRRSDSMRCPDAPGIEREAPPMSSRLGDAEGRSSRSSPSPPPGALSGSSWPDGSGTTPGDNARNQSAKRFCRTLKKEKKKRSRLTWTSRFVMPKRAPIASRTSNPGLSVWSKSAVRDSSCSGVIVFRFGLTCGAVSCTRTAAPLDDGGGATVFTKRRGRVLGWYG